jgi:uncharacterized protein YfkK (UPF0435 family)
MTNKSLKRMIDLMGIKKPINEQTSNSTVELRKKSPNGKIYGIVRENRKYFIKESTDGINYEYIGGLGNKTKNQYQSYEEASRRLNIMFEDFNRSYGIQENNNMLSPDAITEKRFVLKSKKKKSTPAPEEEFGFGDDSGETEDEGTEEEFDFGGEEDTEEGTEEGTEEEFDFGGEEDTEEEDTEEGEEGTEEGEEGTEEGEEGTEEELDFGGEEDMEEEDTEEFDEDDEDYDLEDDPIKDIQRMTGKLGQKIRDTEDLSSDTMKWVAKSVISALDLENMDSNDKRDIIRSIKKGKNKSSDEESDFMGRGRNRQSYQENDSTDYMGMTSWDELTKEEKEEIISGMNNGIGGDELNQLKL